ncbi:uncharacterized protein [Periplaneta americana]|uniref:uncharacterized protein isoform X1 n=2 Tax=Periplaneta americana TaxID=6978 RepID=UPI0037E7652C
MSLLSYFMSFLSLSGDCSYDSVISESVEELNTFLPKECCSIQIEAPTEAEEQCGVEKKRTVSETSCQSGSQPRDTAAPDTFTKQNANPLRLRGIMKERRLSASSSRGLRTSCPLADSADSSGGSESGKTKRRRKKSITINKTKHDTHNTSRNLLPVHIMKKFLYSLPFITNHSLHFRNVFTSLLIINQMLPVSVSAQMNIIYCPSQCICEFDDFVGLSVNCNYDNLVAIPRLNNTGAIQSLDISNNQLTRIKKGDFKDLAALEDLNMAFNEIDVIDSGVFSELQKLRSIDLAYNNLRFISSRIFSVNPVLEAVSLKGNPLVYVPEALPILESSSVLSLDLSFCTLTALNSFTFSELPNLQSLDLNSNHLRDIQLEDLDYLTELTVLDLGNNLWNCDCSLMYVLNWFSERRRSQELEGDHRPVKCLEAGIYKTWWTSAKEVRPCDTKKPRNLVETFYTEHAEMSESKEYNVGTSTWDEFSSLNVETFMIFLVMPLVFGIATFITLVSVNFFTNWIKSVRQVEMTDRSSNKCMEHRFSRIPLIATHLPTNSPNQLQVTNSLSTSDNSSLDDPYKYYERIN